MLLKWVETPITTSCKLDYVSLKYLFQVCDCHIVSNILIFKTEHGGVLVEYRTGARGPLIKTSLNWDDFGIRKFIVFLLLVSVCFGLTVSASMKIKLSNEQTGIERSSRVSDSESRCPWFDPHWRHHVVSLSKTHLLPKVLVKPRKRWLCPNMTEKLLTGTLSLNTKNSKLVINYISSENLFE